MPKSRTRCLAGVLSAAVLLLASSSPAQEAAQGTVPDEWKAARQAILEFDWRGVVERYAPLQAGSKPGSPEWNEATFAIATAHHQMQPASASTMALAAEFYDQVVQHAGDPKYVGRAMLTTPATRPTSPPPATGTTRSPPASPGSPSPPRRRCGRGRRW
jgi:hypothetical protein